MRQKFKKGLGDNDLTYPVTQEQMQNLKPCDAVDVCVGKRNGLADPDFDQLESTREIQNVRNMVSMGMFPYEFMQKYWPFEGELDLRAGLPAPLKMAGLRIDRPIELANVVHMDLPSDMPNYVLKWLKKDGAKLRRDNPKFKDFQRAIVDPLEDSLDGVKYGLDKAFECKWFFGEARPEEIAKKIYPELEPKYFTAYTEGCPPHCDFPAGHGGAAGGGVKRIIPHFDLTKRQLTIILTTAYLWAMFRSLAGVHHAEANVAGLAVGGLKKYFTDEAKSKYLV